MLENIVAQFLEKPEVYSIYTFGNGHIHDTYRVENKDPESSDYLLQKINQTVFLSPEKLMENIFVTTNFLQASPEDTRQLKVITTHEGASFFKDESGEYWRMYPFFKDLIAYDFPDEDSVIAEKQIESAGHAFGKFVGDLRELPIEKIHPVLPDFHRVTWRLEQLQAAIQEDPLDRVATVEREISVMKKLIPKMTLLDAWMDMEMIPVRITHNDTKFNNVLFDQDHTAQVVIDLDTIMPGCIHFDYGDGLRTAAVTAAEDDVQGATVDWDRYEAFHKGYLAATEEWLTPFEIETLPLAASTLAYIMSVRFLTDYINGDVYYKISDPMQNLRRAETQLKLAQLFMLKPEKEEDDPQNDNSNTLDSSESFNLL